jgi:hypothetical protein
MSEDSGGFLSRWSRRKRAAVAPPPAVPPPSPTGRSTAASRAARCGADLRSRKLAAVESLTVEATSPASCARRCGRLRRAALRRAWTLDPAISGFAGPADYAWTSTRPEGKAASRWSWTADVAACSPSDPVWRSAGGTGAGGRRRARRRRSRAPPTEWRSCEGPRKLRPRKAGRAGRRALPPAGADARSPNGGGGTAGRCPLDGGEQGIFSCGPRGKRAQDEGGGSK